jgi:hypothetical protein
LLMCMVRLPEQEWLTISVSSSELCRRLGDEVDQAAW